MGSDERTVILTFPDATADAGNRNATDLMDFLADFVPGTHIEKRRERADAQDMGASLALVLGTTAATALARGIATWLQRNSGARVTIKNSQGELMAEGLESKDAARIIEALSKTRKGT